MRIQWHEEQAKGSDLQRLTRGQFCFLFLKRASQRTAKEKIHIDSVIEINDRFAKLEIIKERMLTFFRKKTGNQLRKSGKKLASGSGKLALVT